MKNVETEIAGKLIKEIKLKLDVLWQCHEEIFYFFGSEIVDHILSKFPEQLFQDNIQMAEKVDELRKVG